MDSEVLSALIAGTVALLVSSVVALWLQRKKLATDYDVTLRIERLAEYRRLWELTEPLGWYGGHEITPEIAQKLLKDLDHWYFQNGAGLLMSELSVSVFEHLLMSLAKSEDSPDTIRKIGTKLRAAMTFNIGGRNSPLLRRSPEKTELEPKVLVAPDTTDKKAHA